MSTFTTKNTAGQTVTRTQLAATPNSAGARGALALTDVTPLTITTTSNGLRAIQTEHGTFLIHPSR